MMYEIGRAQEARKWLLRSCDPTKFATYAKKSQRTRLRRLRKRSETGY